MECDRLTIGRIGRHGAFIRIRGKCPVEDIILVVAQLDGSGGVVVVFAPADLIFCLGLVERCEGVGAGGCFGDDCAVDNVVVVVVDNGIAHYCVGGESDVAVEPVKDDEGAGCGVERAATVRKPQIDTVVETHVLAVRHLILNTNGSGGVRNAAGICGDDRSVNGCSVIENRDGFSAVWVRRHR